MCTKNPFKLSFQRRRYRRPQLFSAIYFTHVPHITLKILHGFDVLFECYEFCNYNIEIGGVRPENEGLIGHIIESKHGGVK